MKEYIQVIPRKKRIKGRHLTMAAPELGIRKEKKTVEMNEEEVALMIEGSKWTNIDFDNVPGIIKKKMVAKVVKVGVRVAIMNHTYEAGGEVRMQKEGGAIGLKLTGAVAKCVMNQWMRKLKKRLEEACLRWYLLIKYVDNTN